MTVQDAIAYIEDHSWNATRLGLERIKMLLAALGNPQRELKFIHVAGSNGKGSVCAMLDAILRRAGYKSGLYISPHIQEFAERIQVNGRFISDGDLARITLRVRKIAESMDDHPSQFELVTAIALEYFREQRCDIVVLEAGMGGALDATNAIDAPELAIITNIGLEHTEYLGNSIEEIAAAKGGIIKPGCHCVCYKGSPLAARVIGAICQEKEIPMVLSSSANLCAICSSLNGQEFIWRGDTYHLALIGEHQLHNAAAVLTGVECLRIRGWNISADAVKAGLVSVRWPARLEVLSREPLFLLDGGHNPQCAKALCRSLEQLVPEQKVVFLLGVLADKDYPAMLSLLLPFAKEFVCVTPCSPRALPAKELADYLNRQGVTATAWYTIGEGISQALERAGARPVVTFGSLYLAGAVRALYPQVFEQYVCRTVLN